jgi:hypothetical protein
MEINTSVMARTGINFFIRPGLKIMYLPEYYHKDNNT